MHWVRVAAVVGVGIIAVHFFLFYLMQLEPVKASATVSRKEGLSILYTHVGEGLVNKLWRDGAAVLPPGKALPSDPANMLLFSGPKNSVFHSTNSSNSTSIPMPVIVLGMPKAGTNTVRDYFVCGGLSVSHFTCDNSYKSQGKGKFKKRYPIPAKHSRLCGPQIRQNIASHRPPLQGLTHYDVHAQIDYENNHGGGCYFPQLQAMKEMHEQYPTATFVLNERDLDNWVSSVSRWYGGGVETMQDRLAACELPGLPKGVGKQPDELKAWYKYLVESVRQFVVDYPTHALIEVDIESDDTGLFMEKFFGISETCWGHANSNLPSLLKQMGDWIEDIVTW